MLNLTGVLGFIPFHPRRQHTNPKLQAGEFENVFHYYLP